MDYFVAQPLAMTSSVIASEAKQSIVLTLYRCSRQVLQCLPATDQPVRSVRVYQYFRRAQPLVVVRRHRKPIGARVQHHYDIPFTGLRKITILSENISAFAYITDDRARRGLLCPAFRRIPGDYAYSVIRVI